MGIQINGATDSITAIDGTIDVVSAIGNAGVVTATAFVGNITGNVTGNINHTSNLELQVGGVTRANIDSTGKVGINQSSPDYELDVTGRIGFTQQIRGASGSQGNPAYAFDGDHDTGMFRNGVNNLCFATAGIQRLTIDENGKLGLGVNATNPAYQLQIHESDSTAYAANATVAQLAVGNVNSSSATNAAGIHLFTDGNGRGLVNLCALNNSINSSADFVIQTRHNSTTGERLRILSSGLVGINSTTPTHHLDVFGNIRSHQQTPALYLQTTANTAQSALIRFGDAGSFQRGSIQYEFSGDNHLRFKMGGLGNNVERLTLKGTNGNLGINDNNPANQLVVKAPGGSGHTVAAVVSGDASTKVTMQAIQGSEGRFGMSTNHPLAIYTSGLERLRIPSDGGLELKDDGRGVKFPDTQTPRNSIARVGISSEMRYYETGTFVPQLSSTVLNSLQIPVFTDASYARRIGRYVRCGHLVFCNIEIKMASTVTYYQAGISDATAPVCIIGVTPFYYAYANRFASSGQPDYNPCNVFYSSSGLTNDTVYACLRREFPGSSYIQITKPGTGGTNQFNSTNYGEVFPANATIAVSYTYAIDTDNIDN